MKTLYKLQETCNYVFNDKGQQFNSRGGESWRSVNDSEIIGAYPFIIYDGKIFGTKTPGGHDDIFQNMIFSEKCYKNISKENMENLLLRHRWEAICGRLYPFVNSDESSILTVWNPKNTHGLKNEKNIAALIKLVGDYFNVDYSNINFETKTGEQIHITYEATPEDIQALLQHTRELTLKDKLNHNTQYENDVALYTGYANTPYSKITPKEKEMFNHLRGEEPRGNDELLKHLIKQNPNFTKAQWNAMSTIGDSKISKKPVINENTLRKIIKNVIKEYFKL